jgi:C-terminal processing protease CtpA/Prc
MVRRGDVIVSIDDRPVRQTKDVLDAIGNEVGKEHCIRIMKAGAQREEATVHLVTAGDKSPPSDRLIPSPKRTGHF